MTSSHYHRGFHGTSTIGVFGAAATAARLLGLDATGFAAAMSIAGTRSAGVRASLGTMCKPLHAGHAAWVGASAARWASRGFTGALDIFADPRGFVAAYVDTPDQAAALAPPRAGYAILGNRFKWHAACHGTHGVIEAVLRLREEHSLVPEITRRIVVHVPPQVRGICDIEFPSSGMEAKFSVRMAAALALAGVDTAAPAAFSDAAVIDPIVAEALRKVEVIYDPALTSGGEAVIETVDGRRLARREDPISEPIDIGAQGRAVRRKFDALARPRLGIERADEIAAMIAQLDSIADISALTELTRA
jgi:2-methylcitrate dehydratase PrpD